MNLQEEQAKEQKKKEYNNEPVLYCKRCLSLRVMNIPTIENSDFCDECGGTDIGEASIEEWEELYKAKYRCNYLDKKY